VITSAALIMVCVFSSFVLNGNAVVKEFGVGLAVAIAIDATIVRSPCRGHDALRQGGLVLPGWLDRLLPRISIEGGDYFAERDPAARTPAEAPAKA
jgi:RND superfamily putative drug exporter